MVRKVITHARRCGLTLQHVTKEELGNIRRSQKERLLRERKAVMMAENGPRDARTGGNDAENGNVRRRAPGIDESVAVDRADPYARAPKYAVGTRIRKRCFGIPFAGEIVEVRHDVRKRFFGTPFVGEVVEVRHGVRYTVRYHEGDSETLEEHEVTEILLPVAQKSSDSAAARASSGKTENQVRVEATGSPKVDSPKCSVGAKADTTEIQRNLAASGPTGDNDSETQKPELRGLALPKVKMTRSCGTCSACLRADCGECKHCLDKTKHGGPNRLHKKCVNRKCLDPKRKNRGAVGTARPESHERRRELDKRALSLHSSDAGPLQRPSKKHCNEKHLRTADAKKPHGEQLQETATGGTNAFFFDGIIKQKDEELEALRTSSKLKNEEYQDLRARYKTQEHIIALKTKEVTAAFETVKQDLETKRELIHWLKEENQTLKAQAEQKQHEFEDRYTELVVKHENESMALKRQLEESTGCRDAALEQLLAIEGEYTELEIALKAKDKEVQNTNQILQEMKTGACIAKHCLLSVSGSNCARGIQICALKKATEESERFQKEQMELLKLKDKEVQALNTQVIRAKEAILLLKASNKTKDIEFMALKRQLEDITGGRDTALEHLLAIEGEYTELEIALKAKDKKVQNMNQISQEMKTGACIAKHCLLSVSDSNCTRGIQICALKKAMKESKRLQKEQMELFKLKDKEVQALNTQVITAKKAIRLLEASNKKKDSQIHTLEKAAEESKGEQKGQTEHKASSKAQALDTEKCKDKENLPLLEESNQNEDSQSRMLSNAVAESKGTQKGDTEAPKLCTGSAMLENKPTGRERSMWSAAEDNEVRKLVGIHGENWKLIYEISSILQERSKYYAHSRNARHAIVMRWKSLQSKQAPDTGHPSRERTTSTTRVANKTNKNIVLAKNRQARVNQGFGSAPDDSEMVSTVTSVPRRLLVKVEENRPRPFTPLRDEDRKSICNLLSSTHLGNATVLPGGSITSMSAVRRITRSGTLISCILFKKDAATTDTTFDLIRLATHEDWQRKGHATACLRVLLGLLRENFGDKDVYLRVAVSKRSEQAQAFYKKNGFKPIPRGRTHGCKQKDCDAYYLMVPDRI